MYEAYIRGRSYSGNGGTRCCYAMEDIRLMSMLLWCPGRSYLILRIAVRQLSSGTTDDIREEED